MNINVLIMQIKHFYIRLDEAYLEADQELLNNFILDKIVKKSTTQFLEIAGNKCWSILVFYESEQESSSSSANKIIYTIEQLNEEEVLIYETLRQWRYNKAQENEVELYMICTNSELITIAKAKPRNQEELMQVKGFGPKKSASYGEDIFAVLEMHENQSF